MSSPLGITDQVRLAFQKQHRVSAFVGSWFAKVAPLGSFALAHFAPLGFDSPRSLFFVGLLTCCLAFSAPKVLRWAHTTFGNWVEAVGFVGLLEGLSLAPHDVHWLLTLASFDALLVLVGVNAITGAVKVAVSQREIRRAEREAEQPQGVKTLAVVRRPAAKITAQRKAVGR